jgi:hypothetical protein
MRVSCAHDQHITGGVPLYFGGNAPAEQTRYARAAMGPHNDEVRLPDARHLDDLLPGDAMDDEASPRDPTLVYALEGAGQAPPGVVRYEPADKGRHGHCHP